MAGKPRRETVVAGSEAQGERLDLFLSRTLVGVSRKSVKRALDRGQVFVDGQVQRRAGFLLAGTETVAVTLDAPSPPAEIPDIPILFRDEFLLAVSKPPGLPSHPTVADRPNALDLVARRLRMEGRETPPILLHRLDADTSGVLLMALTSEANRDLYRQFTGREVEKVYLALVAGSPPETFSVSNYLHAGVRGRTVSVLSGGQPAETSFRVLKRQEGVALVEARPRTGRTHQIRVHLADEGFPILGDVLYHGPNEVTMGDRRFRIRRHLLHAYQLTFRHPASGETVTVIAQLPEDFNIGRL